MQAIWNAIYPHIDYTVEVDGSVYYIVSRFVYCYPILYTVLTVNRPNNVLLSGGVPLDPMPL